MNDRIEAAREMARSRASERQQRIIFPPGVDGSTVVKAGVVAINVGEVLFDTVRGCRYYDGDLIEDEGGVTQEWDPTNASHAFEPGIGVAQLWDNGPTSVLILNDQTVTEAPLDMYGDTPVAVRLGEPVTIPVIGSSPAATITAYPVRLL